MEIGSEFSFSLQEFQHTENNIFNYLSKYNCLYVDSGRSALRILRTVIEHDKTILLPSYMCEIVAQCFQGYDIQYYDVDMKLNIKFSSLCEKLTENVGAIMIAHYFGKLQDADMLGRISLICKRKGIVVIEDTTHSIFSNVRTIGDYCICSLRKWFPIPDGGVLYSASALPKCEIYQEAEWIYDKEYAMVLKALFLEDKCECNAIYRRLFTEAEEALNRQDKICVMSEFSHILLVNYNVQRIIAKRYNNYKILQNNLKQYKILLYDENPKCPFSCPIIVENRDELRKYLIKNKIYCAVHLPIVTEDLLKRETVPKIKETIMSLPIDQRYSEKEMKHLIDIIQKYFERNEGRYGKNIYNS